MKREAQKRKVRFPGLMAASAALGVNRTHLYKVLSNKRSSKRLLARYKALKASQAQPATPQPPGS
jgi:hypothetical protein